jgi:hypothetical protein
MRENRKTKFGEHESLEFVSKRVGRHRSMELPHKAKFKEKTNHCQGASSSPAMANHD